MRWPYGFYRVAGESMQPTYQAGDTLLGNRWAQPRPGAVVVARVQGRPVVKRVARLTTQTAWLLGDNPAHSTDSRHYGAVPRTSIEAVIIRAFAK